MYVVYWHISGEAEFILPLDKGKIRLFDSFFSKPLKIQTKDRELLLPAGGRRYLDCGGLSKDQIVHAFHNLRLIKSKPQQ
jgi:hypothetical protein